MPAPFPAEDKPTYSYKYPDPPPYEPPKTEIDTDWVTALILVSFVVAIFSGALYLNNSQNVELENALKTMSCNEFTLKYNALHTFSMVVRKSFIDKCYKDSGLDAELDYTEVLKYFNRLSCDKLADHVRFHSFYYDDAEREFNVRC